MKASKYNYIFHTDKGSYWMNGITKGCLKFSRSLGEKVENLLESPETIKYNSEKLYDLLSDGGFIIPKDNDELETIRSYYKQSVEDKNYFLIVMSTLNCNFTCHYCTQNHIPSNMSPETVALIKKHLKYMIEVEKITSLHLDWFGGEPFLYFDIIKDLTEYARDLCKEADIPFMSGATSNGSLITKEVAKQLGDLCFRQFQITLDGNRELHNSVKFNDQIESAFDTTIDNIINIIRHNPQIYIALRINYTDETLKSNLIEEISEKFPDDVRSNINLFLKKVWQNQSDKHRFQAYLQVLDGFRNNGFNVSWMDIIYDFKPCYVNKKYYLCINHDGSVLKCTNCDDLYSDEKRGKLNEDGSISWFNDFDKKNMEPAFENPNCLNCFRLPICMGHCPRNNMLLQKWSCKWGAIDIDLKEALIAHIDNQYIHQ